MIEDNLMDLDDTLRLLCGVGMNDYIAFLLNPDYSFIHERIKYRVDIFAVSGTYTEFKEPYILILYFLVNKYRNMDKHLFGYFDQDSIDSIYSDLGISRRR